MDEPLSRTDVDPLDELDNLLAPESPDEEPLGIPDPDGGRFEIRSGKYKGIVLNRMINVKPQYYERVMALKAEIIHDPEFQRYASTIAATYADLRREVEARTAELSELKLRLSAVTLLMIDQFEAEAESGITLKSGDKIRWQPEPHLIVTDKEQFRQWCLRQQLERDMVLPWGKANKLIKDMLVDGLPEPPGTECFVRPKVFFTRGDK
jgi:hypothetical protein